jgi:hypothetical protein
MFKIFQKFCQPKEVSLHLVGFKEDLHGIDLHEIDERISENVGWNECFPMTTNIKVAAKDAEEIIQKLKESRDILSVNHEITAAGELFYKSRSLKA